MKRKNKDLNPWLDLRIHPITGFLVSQRVKNVGNNDPNAEDGPTWYTKKRK